MVFELFTNPTKYRPMCWMSGHMKVCMLEDIKAEMSDEESVRRFARVVRGDTEDLTFAQPPPVPHNLRGAFTMLDGEVFPNNLPEMCRLFKDEAPGIKLTTYGLISEVFSQRLYDLPYLQGCRKLAPYIDRYKGATDVVDCSFYCGRDSTKPVDDERDCAINIKAFHNLISLFKHFFPKNETAAVIWPRMLFAPTDTPIPDSCIEEYVAEAKRCDHQCVFDLRESDKLFIAAIDR